MVLCYCFVLFCVFFFFKRKTAYEMRISDWSSDVCSSDLEAVINELQDFFQKQSFVYTLSPGKIDSLNSFLREKRGWCAHYASATAMLIKIGRASCRERVCQYV